MNSILYNNYFSSLTFAEMFKDKTEAIKNLYQKIASAICAEVAMEGDLTSAKEFIKVLTKKQAYWKNKDHKIYLLYKRLAKQFMGL